ncbi:peroxiredoxin [Pokkaliibacter sp. MBI-7]|uniref:peroxiredoxin n=1 Tax=Pokkaliibacter sp. MBI-7 TaxID=3040600 RepID=UPI00244B37EA|nr:peroxiredoxin [Pokkaliibacter sp. MBI-7]MDH2431693.1 peroxiredoxin [Pokkaliibacter sp. MBI-7]
MMLSTPLPSTTLWRLDEQGVSSGNSLQWLGQGKVLLIGVPGAFTPTCSNQHLPGLLASKDALQAAGVTTLACMAVNDAFVMAAWGRQLSAEGSIQMLSDGQAELTLALGLQQDASARGMGIRCKRFALLLENGVITRAWVDEPGRFELTSAEHILAELS